jgi:hypothetical protein
LLDEKVEWLAQLPAEELRSYARGLTGREVVYRHARPYEIRVGSEPDDSQSELTRVLATVANFPDDERPISGGVVVTADGRVVGAVARLGFG